MAPDVYLDFHMNAPKLKGYAKLYSGNYAPYRS